MKKYIDDDNQVVDLVAKSIIMSSSAAKDANNELIKVMKNLETITTSAANPMGEVNFAIAKYMSDRKEAFSFIAMGVPQVLYLFYELPKSENPSGKIPWRITDKQKEKIIRDINDLFGEGILKYITARKNQTGQYNIVMYVMTNIRAQLMLNTYEEAKKLGDGY